MLKKSLSVLLTLVMLFGIINIFPVFISAQEINVSKDGADIGLAETGVTQNEAVNWIKARADESWWEDVDGKNNCQCVDLIQAYYQFFGYSRLTGSAYQYVSDRLPFGSDWYYSNTPIPGSVFVQNAADAGLDTGHIGLVYAVDDTFVYTVETNIVPSSNGYAGERGYANARYSKKYRNKVTTYINPDFGLVFSPLNLGDHFYAAIIHEATGKALTENNENVDLQNRDGRNKQRWEFIRQSDDTYEIVNFHTGELLEVEHGSTDIGANVGTWWKNDGDCQRWYIVSENGGYVFIPKNAQDRALDLSYTGNIQIWSQNFEEYQVFSLDYQPSFTPEDIGTDFYANIIHLNTGKTINQINDDVLLGERDNSDATIWHFIRQADTCYKIVNVENNKCLDVNRGLSDNHTNIQTYDSLDNYPQRWFLTARNGGYVLVPKCALSSALDLSYTGNIQLYEQTFSSDQLYNIEKLPINQQNLGDHFFASIIHKESGKAVTENNENVYLQSLNGSDKQRWEFTKQNDGSYEIKNTNTYELLEVEHAKTEIGTNVGTWWSNGGDCQYWYIQYINGAYAFSPKHAPYRAMDLSYTGNIQIWSLIYNSDQLFTINKLDESPTEPTIDTILGDADGDGEVSAMDVTVIQRKTAGMNLPAYIEWNEAVCDVNGDDEVDMLDVTLILRWIAGINVKYPIGEALS